MSRVFELSTYKGQTCVIVQDIPNLELMILFVGTVHECNELIDRLHEAESRGMIRGNEE